MRERERERERVCVWVCLVEFAIVPPQLLFPPFVFGLVALNVTLVHPLSLSHSHATAA